MPADPSSSLALDAITAELSAACGKLRFAAPVTHVYNPLVYAGKIHGAYASQFGAGPKKVIFLGMNPGPFGMAQTGVPFGEIGFVRDWLGLSGEVAQPEQPHPQRPVEGFACKRSEVSGKRLWGLFKSRYTTPAAFFADHYVANYCPLVFMEESGKNFTPDQLPAAESAPLYAACDRHLAQLVAALKPAYVVGVGGFAAERAREALATPLKAGAVKVVQVLHPSPASPAANKDWAGQVTKALTTAGIWV
jgi:single-strand selective monofunctional uracil DNA glycosylase